MIAKHIYKYNKKNVPSSIGRYAVYFAVRGIVYINLTECLIYRYLM